jgi:triacylglycerol lipase
MSEPSRKGSAPGVATAASLGLEYLDRLVVGTVRDVHHAVGRRSFRATGPVSTPVRLMHDGISSSVYGILGASLRTTGAVLRRRDRRGGGRALDETYAGRRAAAIANGFIGETLAEENHPMAIEMSARVDGRDVTDLAQAFPDATADVAIFLHGLVEDDESWHWGAEPGAPTYADRLRSDTSWTPVTLRYNTGLPVARNGALLSEWLTALLRDWPTPVRRIALVGHSMGGLVALAACEEGATSAEWTPLVRHVVCLGTPHLGAPLEQLVHWGARTLSRFPESTPFATILNTRSAGILDLREAVPDCTPLPDASYHCVSASMRAPFGLVVGDLLVRRASATGRIPGGTAQHLPDTHHFQLLNHPEVYADLLRRLTEPSTDSTGDAGEPSARLRA